MERTIGFKERRYIEELRILTKSTAVDCLLDERFDRIIYIIRPGDMGLAIGKKGENIRRMQKVLGRKIEMVEYSENPGEFMANMFRPAVVSRATEEDGRVNIVIGKKADLGLAIGRGGANVEKARLLFRRFFGQELGEILAPEDGS
ncbi:MAG TPA: NusA-like transcription termination signal-binding factor [Methanomicrobiales archaeon]|jgi:N utilization substance protein A|nr:NusA-like transcription termination signal-binding factor [Methanomicrobiales archaeon]